MACPKTKNVAVLDTQTLLSEYSCILTDISSVYYAIITQRDVTYKAWR
jgi:hypothetical protein